MKWLISQARRVIYNRNRIKRFKTTYCRADQKYILLVLMVVNPLSPKSDQHQFSPNNIHTLSRKKVRRINKMITN